MTYRLKVDEDNYHEMAFHHKDIIVLFDNVFCQMVSDSLVVYKECLVEVRVLIKRIKYVFKNGLIFAYRLKKEDDLKYNDRYCELYFKTHPKEKRKNKIMRKNKVNEMNFSNVYDLLVQKLERKGYSKDDMDRLTLWLTGYTQEDLDEILKSQTTMEEFYNQTPAFNEKAKLIKGSICGYKVQEIEDEFTWKYRCLDKLVDELYKGKDIEKVLFNK